MNASKLTPKPHSPESTSPADIGSLNVADLRVCLSAVTDMVEAARRTQDYVLHLCGNDTSNPAYRRAAQVLKERQDVRVRLIRTIEDLDRDDF